MFAPLSQLGLARRGAAGYFSALLRSDDELIRFGAYCQLLGLGALPPERYDDILPLCQHGAIKSRAFVFFKNILDFDMAERVAGTPVENIDAAVSARMKADLLLDYPAALAASVRMFRSTGDIRDLLRAATAAELAGGWRASVEWSVRAAAIAPLDPQPFVKAFRDLSQANQHQAVYDLAALLNRAGLHPFPSAVFVAAARLGEGDSASALKLLAALPTSGDTQHAAIRDVRGLALKLQGEALDKLGNYQGSYKAFVELHRLELNPAIDPKSAVANALQQAAMHVPELPRAVRDDVTMMLGFPRSGTTLLELALGAHPLVEAYEERPTWDAALAFLRRARRLGRAGDETAPFVQAREVYFREVDRFRTKPAARHVVDKFPMRTIYASTLQGILPEQKYIFCVRHPYDVVLSCFRQRFAANPAMESFRDFGSVIAFYDFVLSQWFKVHTLEDAHVHYLRYDRLVTDFDAAVGGALGFMGLAWDDGVRGFTQDAETKMALTPSYQKIRRGLSIGVQTYWRNYDFLFSTPEAAPMRKWAAFFGYETA